MVKKSVVCAGVALAVAVAAPTGAQAKGFIPDELSYGFFYGTFDQSPNVALFAGGPIETFCALPDPGTAPLRVFPRPDGSTDLKVNAPDQPIYLYETDFNDVPQWLEAICPGLEAGETPPSSFATGEANLKVRISVITDDYVEVFNSVNGKATGVDGTQYKVKGSADLVVENGMPVGDPRDFVTFKLTEIRR